MIEVPLSFWKRETKSSEPPFKGTGSRDLMDSLSELFKGGEKTGGLAYDRASKLIVDRLRAFSRASRDSSEGRSIPPPLHEKAERNNDVVAAESC